MPFHPSAHPVHSPVLKPFSPHALPHPFCHLPSDTSLIQHPALEITPDDPWGKEIQSLPHSNMEALKGTLLQKKVYPESWHQIKCQKSNPFHMTKANISGGKWERTMGMRNLITIAVRLTVARNLALHFGWFSWHHISWPQGHLVKKG